ncbi:MAG: hypothetical protein V7709_02500 [Halioglobus sp.]
MSRGKAGALVFYALLAILAITQAGTTVGTIVNGIIVALVVVHALEVIIFFKLCKEAGGSLLGHLFNVFVFGYFHTAELKARVA